ncbi:MAG: ribonuclease HII [Pseudomonadota bacterium]
MTQTFIAGVDEAGRGPLAGPVVAAAVILDPNQPIAGVADSKKLSASRRETLFARIQKHSISYCIAEASVEEIDRLNILHATMLAMQRAVTGLRIEPALVRIDGNRAPDLGSLCTETLVGGDGIDPAIGAASILAKVHRDRLMVDLDARYQGYGLAKHKGYPTAEHLASLQTLGPCPIHRQSYAPVRQARLFE